MLRREYLRGTGVAAMAVVAGCTGGSDDGGAGSPTPTESATPSPSPTASPTPSPTPTPTPSPTPEPTPTPTPEARKPEIEVLSLVTRWQDFGDAVENQLDAAAVDSAITIATRYDLLIRDNTFDVLQQYRVRDPSGSRIALEKFEDSQLTDSNGLQTWEGAYVFDTSDWPGTGTYEVELIIRDNALGKTSEPATSTFQLSAPISPSDVSVTSVDHPDTVGVDEEFNIRVFAQNQSSRDGTFLSTMSYTREDTSEWFTYEDFTLQVPFAAGEEGYGDGSGFFFTEPGTYTQRIDELDYEWTVTVE